MNLVGQGGKIILFMLPALIAAILVHSYLPDVAALHLGRGFFKILGYIWFLPGIVLWLNAIVNLFINFPKGKLVTSCAYSIVRNPIYASVIWFILPAVSFVTGTWVYLAVSAFLYLGVVIFIKQEEEQLLRVFGQEYADYMKKVHRLVPLIKP